MKLSKENYKKGYLVDEQWIAGIAENGDSVFEAYVMDHSSGEILGSDKFSNIDAALGSVNQIDRPWEFEPFKKDCSKPDCSAGECSSTKCHTSLGRFA